MHFYLAGDTGNAKFKGVILDSFNHELKVVLQRTITSKITTLPIFAEIEESVAVANLLNNMVIQVNSPGLKRTGLYAVGEKGSAVGPSPRNMDIRAANKYTEIQFLLLPLSTIAARAVQMHFVQHKKIPSSLDVAVTYSTAIPAREYGAKTASAAAELFLKGPHIVDIYATPTPTTVHITFKEVKVYQEGVPALEAIRKGKKEMFELYKERYKEDFDVESLTKTKVLLVDIGDGTTEVIYLDEGKPDVDRSYGDQLGVGHATEQAIAYLLSNLNLPLKMDRQQFMDAHNDTKHQYHSDAIEALEESNIDQIDAIFTFVRNCFLNVSGDASLIIVSGGGSITFEKELKPRLYEFADSAKIKVLWIPEGMAASLNAMGLDILNRYPEVAVVND